MANYMRLDRFFSSQGIASRKQVRELIKKGRITINETPAKKADIPIDPDRDQICLDQQPVRYQKYIYLMLNKPQGVVCATEDRHDPTVLDLITPELFRRGLFPAGRLDKDTTGFVLLTDDGAYAHRILSPKNHVEKTYLARLDAPVSEKMLQIFPKGVVLSDGTQCQPAKICILEEGQTPLVEIVLQEGKYHQVKRMTAAFGCHVTALKRTQIGSLSLDANLAEGACREILHKELP